MGNDGVTSDIEESGTFDEDRDEGYIAGSTFEIEIYEVDDEYDSELNYEKYGDGIRYLTDRFLETLNFNKTSDGQYSRNIVYGTVEVSLAEFEEGMYEVSMGLWDSKK